MSGVKHIVPFEGKTKEDVESTGVFTFISYASLRKLLEPAVDIDEDEKITGLVISEDGIKVRIDQT